MAKLQDNYYFQQFIKLVQFSVEAATFLKDILQNFDRRTLLADVQAMHKIEHAADLAQHELMQKLAKEFITPIEREDIIAICQKIDDVTDAIEDVLFRLYMYNVQTLRSDCGEFNDVIIEGCKALKLAIMEFPNFKRSRGIEPYIVEVNRLEEVGDRIYIDAVRRLFIEEENPVELIVWEELYHRFEKCSDSIEDVAGAIETVIMKNR
jgi:predicted phosphate transport protein (TIGR00153 family)